MSRSSTTEARHKSQISEEVLLLRCWIKHAVIVLTKNEVDSQFTVHSIFKAVVEKCTLIKTQGIYREITITIRELRMGKYVEENRKGRYRCYVLLKRIDAS